MRKKIPHNMPFLSSKQKVQNKYFTPVDKFHDGAFPCMLAEIHFFRRKINLGEVLSVNGMMKTLTTKQEDQYTFHRNSILDTTFWNLTEP